MDNLQLEKQLCFKLYRANKLMNRLYVPVLKELGLTYPQYLVMLVMWQANKTISVKDLGQALDLDSGTLSPLLKRLEKQQLITRKRSTVDERSVEICLTPAGRELKSQALAIPENMLATSGLSLKALQSLSSQLEQLIEKLSD